MNESHLNWKVGLLLAILALVTHLSPVVAAPPPQGDDPQVQAEALFEEGLELLQMDQVPAALPKFEAALPLYQAAHDRRGEAFCLLLIGFAKDRSGDYAGALETYEASLTIWRAIDNGRVGEGTALNNIGLIYYNLGQYQQALDHYQQALIIRQEIGDQAMEGETLNNIGGVYASWGQYKQALDYFQQALAIFQEIGRQEGGEGQGAALLGIGDAYHDLGQYEQALDYYQQALAIQEEVGDRMGKGITLSNIGRAYDDLSQYEQALKYYQQALPIQQEVGDRAGQGTTLSNFALAYDNLGQYEQALGYYQQALVIRREIGDRAGEATTLANIGAVYQNLGQYQQALDHYRQALAIAEDIGDRVGEGTILGNIGLVYEKLDDTGQAIAFYRQAIEAKESVQGNIKIEELKASFAGEQATTYEHLVNLLWQEGRLEEAFNYTERARARAFLDQLAGGAIDFRTGANAKLLEREQALRAEIAARHDHLVTLRNRPSSEWDTAAIAATQTELTALEKEYTTLLVDLKIQSPEYAFLVGVDVASLAEVQALLDPNTTLVEYFVIKDYTLAFVITHNAFEVRSLNVSREELSQTITTFRDFASLDDPHPASLQQLYHWLIEPLKPHLSTATLGIIPHNVLHYLPFAALTNGERYLNDDYTLFTLPSASVLRFVQEKRKPTPTTVLALGNPTTTEPLPDLHFAQQEVETIVGLYGSQALIGVAATESAVQLQVGEAGILHLAAHGTYNPYNPLFSAIQLARDDKNDGRLEVHEIYSLNLTSMTDLVVLSACQTVIGELSAGDEVVGLNRAFLYAGTPTVIASLWNVDDAATSLLMERFYTHLRAGLGKAEALRQAQLEVRQSYPSPYYWSAFVLSGDAGKLGTPPAPQLSENPPVLATRLLGSTILPAALIGFAAIGAAVVLGWRWRKQRRQL